MPLFTPANKDFLSQLQRLSATPEYLPALECYISALSAQISTLETYNSRLETLVDHLGHDIQQLDTLQSDAIENLTTTYESRLKALVDRNQAQTASLETWKEDAKQKELEQRLKVLELQAENWRLRTMLSGCGRGTAIQASAAGVSASKVDDGSPGSCDTSTGAIASDLREFKLEQRLLEISKEVQTSNRRFAIALASEEVAEEIQEVFENKGSSDGGITPDEIGAAIIE